MRTILLSLLISSFGFVSIAQVGINNTNPQAQLDIVAGATPSEKDGLLIPRLDEYPTGVGADQNGMLIFITGNGTPSKGFYYWDHTAMSWQSFVAPAGTSDADWYEAGTTNIPDAIADNLVTQGNVTIGNSLVAGVAKLNVFSSDGDNTTLRIDNSGTIGLEKSGILISNGTLDGTDTERYIGVLSSHSSTDAFQQTGFKSDFSNLSNNGVYYGLNNEYPAGASNGFQRGVRNYFGGGQSAFGIENSFPGAFSYSGTTYGVYNTLQSGGNGIKYGVFNSISGLGTGTKYGTYNNISSTSGGTHYGVYSDVRKANSYSGFFIGRVSFGADGVLNRYLMPTTDGTNGQVMTTDGSGNITFQDVVGDGTNSLDEAYDEGGAGSGRIITADNGAVDIQDTGGLRVEGDIIAAQNIVHDGDIDTSLQFTPDRIELDAGGTNYVNIQNDNSIIVFNEDSSAIDLRIESDNENHMFFVDGSENAIGIGRTNPVSPLQIGISTNFDLAANNIGQDGLFLIGSDNTGLNSYGASIGLGGPTTSRKNSRRAAIATVQTGPDVDNIGLSFFIHSNGINLSDMREGMRLSHQGFLGVNNSDPDATLDVAGTFQFVDGNEANGFILSSDATGNASWVDPTTVFSDTDNQVIDNLNLNGTTLEISLEDDGVVDETLDLSIFANAEKIDDLLDGKSDNDGSDNGSSVFLGLDAGAADDSSHNRNVGIGYQSLEDNTTGENNAAVGYLSLNKNTIGSQNTAIGEASLNANIDGNNNTGLGYHALFSNSNGSNNTAVGFGTLGVNISGGFNAAVGTQVLPFNSASSNTAMGYRASYSNTSGTRNAAFGLESLNFNSIGNDNVAVGYRAGYSTTGSGNVYLGSEAGNGTSGSNRLFIENTGADADNALIYGEFGADATTTGNILRTNSEFQIGNPTGTGYAFPLVDGTVNQILATNGSGQIGFVDSSTVFTTSAANGLNVDAGVVELGGPLTENTSITFGAASLQFDIVGSGDFRILDATSNPRLAVRSNGLVSVGSDVAQGIFNVTGTSYYSDDLYLRDGAVNTGDVLARLYDSADDGVLDLYQNNSVSARLHGNGTSFFDGGKVAIGHTAAAGFLDILADNSGAQPHINLVDFGASGARINFSNTATTGGNVWTFFGDTDDVTANSRFNLFHTGTGNIMVVTGDGETGFGDTTPDATLDVDGTFQYTDGTQAAGRLLQSDANGTATWVDPTSFISASNGLTETAGDVKLGGALTEDTTLTLGAFDAIYNLSGNGEFLIQDAGVNKFEINNAGDTVLGGDFYMRDENTGGTLLARLVDVGSDAVFQLYGNGAVNHDIRANATTVFNSQNLDLDFRIESDNETYALMIDGGEDILRVHNSAGGTAQQGTVKSVNGSNVTVDYIANFQGGTGSTVGLGTAEFVTDSGNQILQFDANMLPFNDNDDNIGSSAYRWNTIYAVNGTINTSDITLKKNIKPLQYGLDKLMDIETISYEWKDSKFSDTKIGFSAQNLQTVLPEVVRDYDEIVVNEDTNEKQRVPAEKLGVYYSDVIPVTVKAIQELKAEIDALKAENEALKANLAEKEDMQARLEKVEAMLFNMTSEKKGTITTASTKTPK